jgi:N-acetylglucosamine kinase-like BadF-type ATPase
VLAVDQEGNVLFQGQSGAANLASTPEGRLRKNLSHATDGCPRPEFVCGCFAGLINDEVRARGEEHLRILFPSAVIRAEPDFTAAFYASPPETDICIIAGTGSLVCSRGPKGMVKSGGRGYILGDYGSAYQYGRDALIRYLDEPDEASLSLRNAVKDLFETHGEGEIIAAVYRAATPASILAKLAKALGADARTGEPYALASIERNTSLLVDVVERHVRKNIFSGPQLTISLAGGLWKGNQIFRDRFSDLVAARLKDRQVVVTRITRPPLYGAVELAKEMSYRN